MGSRCARVQLGRHSENFGRRPTLFAPSIDIRKAFDNAWVEATLVRLAQIGVTGGIWRTITNFLVGTISQVRIGDAQSHPWMDTGIAQGRVLSPQLFRCCPGVRLVPASDVRFVCQLCADDVAILAESAEGLKRGLDAVTSWGRKWRFTFGVSPEKSAVMIFGPLRRTPSCSVTSSNLELPVVRTYRYLGVILTPSLSWSAHTSHLTTRGLRFFAQSTSVVSQRRSPYLFRAFLDEHLRAPERSLRIGVCK